MPVFNNVCGTENHLLVLVLLKSVEVFPLDFCRESTIKPFSYVEPTVQTVQTAGSVLSPLRQGGKLADESSHL